VRRGSRALVQCDDAERRDIEKCAKKFGGMLVWHAQIVYRLTTNHGDLERSLRRDAVKIAGPLWQRSLRRSWGSGNRQGDRDRVRFGTDRHGQPRDYLLKHLLRHRQWHCIALCDINQEHLDRSARLSEPRETQGLPELLNRTDVDAVLIATPLFTHFAITRDALLAGKHVFCEKSLVFKPHQR